MVKLVGLIVLGVVSSATAFAPTPTTRAFVRSTSDVVALRMSEEAAEPVAEPAAPSEPSEPVGGALVPIKEETIEFTAGLLGGVAGLAVGGPVLGALGAAAANYAAKSDSEVSEVIGAVSKSSIEVYNYLAKLDAKFAVLENAKTSLESALEKLKSSDNVDPETVKKVESALKSTTDKIQEVNEEYDLIGAGSTALGVIGDLVEKAVVKAGELNEEYKLTDKAMSAIKEAVEKAKAAAAK
eukprot:CAMPEP_0185723476 /NCGR_PEP_ID=MMETSP1171-20130828/298_1 /TAXON_ID=374046 /ORGANISM="Helicotheca tamensis, Strain CCMP826" /LENGTH=239 /DNA_ID=CAMNT_0028391183 /DNA_START=48 /DNA_END=767 /DNA_ORIENTATION=+